MEYVKPIASTPSPSSISVPAAALLAGLLIFAVGATGEDFDIVALAALSLVAGVLCLWRPGDTQILLVVYLFQWLQATMPLFQAAAAGIGVDDLYVRPGLYTDAVALTHLALICLAAGMRIVMPRLNSGTRLRISRTLAGKPTSYWFGLYLIFFVIGNLSNLAISLAPGLSQVLLGIDNLRWAFFLILSASGFQRPGGSLFFLTAFALELILGFSGFFSDFKTVFIVSFLGLMLSGARISAKWILLAGLIGLSVVYFGIVWTVIKPEYRNYISGGARQQIVVVPFAERMEKLVELSTSVDGERFGDGIDQLVSRIGYVEFFGGTLAHVPAIVPHESGALIIDAAQRPFMPRYFFPEKEVIDDSLRTRKYTGWMVSGSEAGTSISLGWIAEAYIDFGRVGMLVAALFVGVFYGLIHRLMSMWEHSRGVFGSAAAAAILINVMFLETSITKSTGGLVAGVLAALIATRFILPIISPYLAQSARAQNA